MDSLFRVFPVLAVMRFSRMMALVMLLVLASCQLQQNQNLSKASFAPEGNYPSSDVSQLSLNIDCDIYNAPFSIVCSYLSRSYNLSVSCDEKYSNSLCSLICSNIPILDALTMLAKQHGLSVLPVGESFHLGVATEDDRVVISGRIYGYDSKELNEALSSALPGCIIHVSTDGYAVISCSVSSAGRAREALRVLQSSRSLYRLRLVVVKKWLRYDLVDGGFVLSANRKLPLSDWFWGSLVVADFTLQIDSLYLRSSVVSTSDFAIIDGGSLDVFSGQKLPIARHSISDSGTNTISGYDNIDIGDKLHVSICSQSDSSCLVSIHHELASLAGYTDNYPIRDSSTLDTTVRLLPGQVYCLGDYLYKDNKLGFLRFGRSHQKYTLLLSVQPCSRLRAVAD